MRTGQNPVDILCNLPSVAPAGSFFVTDPLGRSPLGYIGFGQSLFYEVNLYNGALQQLANLPGGLVFGAGTCASYDGFNGRVWVFGPGTGAGVDSYTGYYNVATGLWVQVDLLGTMDALLAATWGTDGALVSLNPSLSGAYPITNGIGVVDLMLRGSGLNAAFQFDIVADTWFNTSAPGAASGAGVSLAPAWGYNENLVYSARQMLRTYNIATDTWTNTIPIPTFVNNVGTGTSAITHPDGRLVLYRLDATGQILAFDPLLDTLAPYAHIYGPDGTATVGSKMCAYKQNGDTYLAVILHGSTQIQRIRIVE